MSSMEVVRGVLRMYFTDARPWTSLFFFLVPYHACLYVTFVLIYDLSPFVAETTRKPDLFIVPATYIFAYFSPGRNR